MYITQAHEKLHDTFLRLIPDHECCVKYHIVMGLYILLGICNNNSVLLRHSVFDYDNDNDNEELFIAK